MHRVATLLFFVISGVCVAVAALKPQGSGTVGSDVVINTFTLTASDGANGDQFGSSVAIDGDTVVVGADDAHRLNGAVYEFVKPPTGWRAMTQTAVLTASDEQLGDAFGVSVAISGDTIVVGAPEATINGIRHLGAVYVFVKTCRRLERHDGNRQAISR